MFLYRLYLLKIEQFAARGAWEELEKLARSKKSPVGYEPFIDAAVANGRRDEAFK